MPGATQLLEKDGRYVNTIAHALFANILLLVGAPELATPYYLVVNALAGVAVDLDHIPKLGKAVRTLRFGQSSRTRWHELQGLLASMLISMLASLLSPELGRALLIGAVSHYFLDLATRPTRPLYPLSESTVFLGMAPSSLRGLFAYDTVLTAAMGVIWIWSLRGLGLLRL